MNTETPWLTDMLNQLIVDSRSVDAPGGQCPIEALDAFYECGGWGRLPLEGCTCVGARS